MPVVKTRYNTRFFRCLPHSLAACINPGEMPSKMNDLFPLHIHCCMKRVVVGMCVFKKTLRRKKNFRQTSIFLISRLAEVRECNNYFL